MATRKSMGAEGPKKSMKVSAATRLRKKSTKGAEGPKSSEYVYRYKSGGSDEYSRVYGSPGRKAPKKSTGVKMTETRGKTMGYRGVLEKARGAEGPKRSMRRTKKK